MRELLERTVRRFFPTMGWRPLYLTACATWLMVLYRYHGGRGEAPAWFIEASQEFFGFELVQFHGYMWSHCSAVFLLMILPLILCWLAEGWSPRDLGFRVKGAGKEVLVVLALWALMIPLVWLVHDAPGFDRIYPRLHAAETSRELFFLFGSLYIVKWIAWEFFFRGFMLFAFQKDFMNRAVLISTVAFTLMHWGKAELEMASAMIAGPVLCYIALRSKSIWPGVLLHWLIASTMDLFASTWWR